MDTPKQPELVAVVIGTVTTQIYCYEDETGQQYHWNVKVGLALAQARNELVPISLLEMGVTLESVRNMNPGVNTLYALTTDLSKPLLFVPIGEKVRLIDGWHRVTRALLTGVDVLPAYFLTQEEADACLLLTLPPGKGIEWGKHGPSDEHALSEQSSKRRR